MQAHYLVEDTSTGNSFDGWFPAEISIEHCALLYGTGHFGINITNSVSNQILRLNNISVTYLFHLKF